MGLVAGFLIATLKGETGILPLSNIQTTGWKPMLPFVLVGDQSLPQLPVLFQYEVGQPDY